MIVLKYNFLVCDTKQQVDSALGIYNTLRWKIDGLIYQLSADMITANSPRRMRLLNEWCLAQPDALMVANTNESNKYKNIQIYTIAIREIDANNTRLLSPGELGKMGK